METRSAAHGRQRAYEILHRPSPPSAGRGNTRLGDRGTRRLKGAGFSPGLALYLGSRPSPEAAEEETPRPDGRLLLINVDHPERAGAIIELVDRLAQIVPDLTILLIHQEDEPVFDRRVVPEDVPVRPRPAEGLPLARAFLDHWRPDLILWAGGKLHPSLMVEAHSRAIPQIMIDARPSEHQTRKLLLAPLARRSLFRRLDRILAGTDEAASRFIRLGARAAAVEAPGFLEEGVSALPCNMAERDELGNLLATRPVWLAAPLRPRMLDQVIVAHRTASRLSHRLLLIVVPEMPADGPLVAERFEYQDWRTALRSQDDQPDEDIQVYVADTEGEMGLWYRLASVTCLLSSLEAPGGSANPYHPAALGSAIIFGQHMGEFSEAAERLAMTGGARRLSSAEALGPTVAELLSPERAAHMAHEAWKITTAGAEVSDRIVALVNETLDGARSVP